MTTKVESDSRRWSSQRNAEDGHGASFDESSSRVNGWSLGKSRNNWLSPGHDRFRGFTLALFTHGCHVDDIRSVGRQVLQLHAGGRGLHGDQRVLGSVRSDAVVQSGK